MSRIHDSFADWYRPADFGVDSGTLESRWKVVESVASELGNSTTFELVRAVFGRGDNLGSFRKKFKDLDPGFLMAGNDNEVLALAGCTLALAMQDITERSGKVGEVVLAGSACRSRKVVVSINLLDMAEHAVALSAEKVRQRPSEGMRQIPKLSKERIDEVVSEIVEPQWDTLTAAFGGVSEIFSGQIKEIKGAIKREHIATQKILQIQDEELETLWWLISEWSEVADRLFKKLQKKSRPIVLPLELSKKTKQKVEPPALKAILARTGIASESVTIPDAINSCGTDLVQSLGVSEVLCSTVFPVHLAIQRAGETGCNNDWVAAWSTKTGIAPDKTHGSLDLALQTYREALICRASDSIVS